MKKLLFHREAIKAKAFHDLGERPDYYRGYLQGLRRRYHGDNFGDPGDHEKWLALVDDDYRREIGQGYRDGYSGPADWNDLPAAVRTIRQWRGWSVDEMGEQIGRSGRTIENWEQGRTAIPDAAVKTLRRIYSE